MAADCGGGGPLVLLLLLSAGALAAQGTPPLGQALQAMQYHMFELAMPVEGPLPSNPFAAEVNVSFAGPGLNKQVVPAFYAGARLFKARYTPTLPGAFQFALADGSGVSFAGNASGVLQVVANSNPSAHGGVIVDSKHPHHFVYEDGSRYFMMGYECDWLWALGLPPDPSPIGLEAFVANLTLGGFNHVLVQVYANRTSWGKDVPRPPRVSPTAQTPWASDDKLTINTAYFDHYDTMLATLNKYNIVAHVMVTVWNKDVAWPPMLSDGDNIYWRYVLARLQAFPNVVIDVSKEANREPNAYWENRLALVHRLNAHQRLVTSHTNCSDWTLCDFRSAQTHSDFYADITEWRQRLPDKPVTNVEFLYESGAVRTYHPLAFNASIIRRTLWDIYLAGGYAAWYYDDTAWDVIMAGTSPGYQVCSVLVRFFTVVVDSYWQLEPSDGLLRVGAGDQGHCLGRDGEYVVYLHSGLPGAAITLPGAGLPLTGQWFDPATGNFIGRGFKLARGAKTSLDPLPRSAEGDLVLYVH